MLIFFSIQHDTKKVRNNVENSSPQGKRRLLINEKQILWSHWDEAYCWIKATILAPFRSVGR